ncbi:YesL family protein [Camelliibacillus cellulosilyticus]|uniref:YesL family protein n=1 Tax=Camelliibacillus cellulosilyticus TaxID=2174486 RepID=A0ABV9GHF1_9BACL
MELRGLWKWVYAFGDWLSRVFVLHLLWIVFSIAGIGVFGLFPATAAMFAVIRKRILGDRDLPTFKTFMAHFKSDFLKVNAIGYTMAAIGCFLYFDLYITRHGIHSMVLYFLLLILGFFYLITVLYLFPVFVHYELKMSHYLKQSFLIAIIRPFETIGCLVILLVFYYLFLFFPILLIFLGAPLIAYPIMWLTNHAFEGVTRKIQAIDNKTDDM